MTERITSNVGIAQINGAELNLGQQLAAASIPVVLPATQAVAAKTIKTVSGTLTADADVIPAVTGKRIKVCAYSVITTGTNLNLAIFKSNGTAGTELWRLALQSVASQVMGANLAVSAPAFLFATVAGEKLTLDVNQSDTLHYSISYYDDDAT